MELNQNSLRNFGKIKISKFEGIITNLWRRVEEKKNQSKEISSYFDEQVCPDCHGEKLNSLSRQITVNKTVITATTKMPLTKLLFQDHKKKLSNNI